MTAFQNSIPLAPPGIVGEWVDEIYIDAEWNLVTVDRSTGEATAVGSPLAFEDFTAFLAMAFDSEGNVWIRRLIDPGIPILPPTAIFRMHGVDTESLELAHDLVNDSRYGFAVSRLRTVVDIPALDTPGRFGLAVFLVVSAFFALRRRHGVAG